MGTTASTTTHQCTKSDWIGDGFCDDETNNPECDYDGDDCCGEAVFADYCSECTGVRNETNQNLMYTITTTTRVKPTGDSSKPLKIQVYILIIKFVCLCVCVCVPPYNSGTLRLILMKLYMRNVHTLGMSKTRKKFSISRKKIRFHDFSDFCRSFNFGDSSVNFKNSKNLLKYREKSRENEEREESTLSAAGLA